VKQKLRTKAHCVSLGGSVYVSAIGERAVFGVPLDQMDVIDWMPSDHLGAKFSGKIPQLLADLKTHLVRTGGLRQEGIFRLAPGDVETQRAKQALNEGNFIPSEFPNPQLYAHLIKLWFRELPPSILNHCDPEKLILCKTSSQCQEIVDAMAPSSRTLLYWLLELMRDVVKYADINFMNPANLGIVMGPNLLPTVDATNPMQALVLNKACTTFLTLLIKG